jgi:prepilin-type N-terminal cleavage/methylation domain-containing protein
MRRLVRRFGGESGYSLIELLTSMAILSVVIGGITTLFVQGSSAESDMNRRFQAQQQARIAVDKMKRDIHCSSKAVKPTSSTLVVLNDPCQAGGSVSWCTAASGSFYALYRSSAATCDATGIRYADNLVNASGAVFTYAQQSTSTLASLHVDLRVNPKPAMTQETYALIDDIVLRNSTRTCVANSGTNFASPTPPC